MNKLSYIYTNPAGVSENISSFEEVRKRVAENGGDFKAIYTPIEKEYDYRGKRVRPVIKGVA